MGNILFIGHFIAEYSDAGMARNKAFRDKFTDMDAVIINPYNRNLFLRFCLLIRTLMTLFFAKEKSIFLLQGTFFILFPIGILKYNIINKTVFSLLKRAARKNQLILEVNDLITLQAKDLELEVNPFMKQIEDKLYCIPLCKYVFASNEMCKYAIDKWSIPSILCNYIINGGTRLNEGIKPSFDNDHLLMVEGPKYIYAGSLNKGRQIEEMISIFKAGGCGFLVLIGIWGDWLLKENLGKYIIYIGNFQEEVAHYITSCCDIGLNPYDESRFYYNICFPSKASFYITAGIPVLSTPLTELKTFMKNTDAGIFFPISKWTEFFNTMDDQKLGWYKKEASGMKEKMSWEFVMKKVDNIIFDRN